MKFEGLKIADQDVARTILIRQGVEVIPGLSVSTLKITPCAFLFDDQDTRPEQVYVPRPIIQLAYMLLVACDGTSLFPKNLEEVVVEALCLTPLVNRVPPLFSEFGGAGTNVVPG